MEVEALLLSVLWRLNLGRKLRRLRVECSFWLLLAGASESVLVSAESFSELVTPEETDAVVVDD